MSLVELIWATDRLSLFTQLESENRDDSFAVRQMLWYVTSGRIKEGNVYVDQWPSFSHVCCLHPTTLYTVRDRDLATLCTNNLGEFGKFFEVLIKERKWRKREGIIFDFVEEQLADVASRILCPDSSYGSLLVSGPFRHYTANDHKNLETYSRQFEEHDAKLGSDVSISNLKPDESHLVADSWTCDLPDKAEMFKWLIETFPSKCTRDSDGRPVGWVMSYSFGATGGAYVLPEYRGRGIQDAQISSLLTELLQIIPGQRYFCVLDDNIASILQTKRHSFDLRRTDVMIKMIVFIPNAPKAHL